VCFALGRVFVFGFDCMSESDMVAKFMGLFLVAGCTSIPVVIVGSAIEENKNKQMEQ